MKNIHDFFNDINTQGGALWLDNDNINVFVPKELQNQDTKDFIVRNKSEMVTILKENNIFSKDSFQNTLIFKDSSISYYPLSPAQERLWFMSQLEKKNSAFHIPEIYQLNADCDIDGIKYALQQIVSRHEVLRSTVEYAADRHGGIQVIHNALLIIEELILNGDDDYEVILKEDIDRPFDLSKEYPIRAKLYFIQPDKLNFEINRKVLLLINTHHIASDGWSIGIFQNEFHAYYEAYINKNTAFQLPPLQIQYKDYARWQKNYLSQPVLEKQLIYWKEKLSGYQNLELPMDNPRPKTKDYKGASLEFVLNKATAEKLRALTKDLAVSLNSVMLSSFSILLGKYTGQDDIVIGRAIANRHHQQAEELIGFFLNIQATRTRLHKAQSYTELIRQVHQEQVESYMYQDLPFEKLVSELGIERDESKHPIFQISFEVRNLERRNNGNEKKKELLKPYHLEGAHNMVKLDLTVIISDTGKELILQIDYATSLFTKETIERFIRHYVQLLDQLAIYPDKFYSQIMLLGPEEYETQLYKWNASDADFTENKTICELFYSQVEKTPDTIAVSFEEQTLTYKELNEKSNQLAYHICNEYKIRTRKTLSPDSLIALCLNRGLEMVVGILAVLKAGGAYVPIDPEYPEERINYILSDTKADIVLSQRTICENVRLQKEKVIYTELSESLYSTQQELNLAVNSRSNNLAYVIYTSGTTGKPKGVMIEHGSLINLVQSQINSFGMKTNDTVLQFASYVFDASVSEIFTALTSGARLLIVPNRIKQDGNLLSDFIENKNVNIATIPPSLLSVMPHRTFAGLRTLIVAGETTALSVMTAWSHGRKLINAYGPTENTVCTTMYEFKIGDTNVNIGKPIENVRVYILDSNHLPVPIGVVGELYISGAGLARGYWNLQEHSKERFTINPFTNRTDIKDKYTRLYKTGDLVKWLPDGCIEYVGRNDDQVKIRGFRIEPKEIEAVLLEHHAISQACVLTRKFPNTLQKRLIAYYVRKQATDNPSNISWWPSIAEYYVYDELLYSLMTNHDERNNCYRMAIRNNVRDKIVVDIGTGPDVVLSRICIEEGAKRVYAIEYLEETYLKAKQAISRYNLADKIYLIHGDSLKVTLPEMADICVSELVGAIGGSEGAAVLLNDAKLRHVKPGGKFIPQASITKMAFVDLPDSLIDNPILSELPYGYTEKIFAQIGYDFDLRLCLKGVSYDNLISSIEVFENLDWSGSDLTPVDHNHGIDIEITRNAMTFGCVVWLDLIVEQGLNVDILNDQHSWIPVFLPVFPEGMQLRKGDRIRGTVERKLCTNGFNFDYIVKGCVYTSGSETEFYYKSVHLSKSQASNSFYKRFFEIYYNYDRHAIHRLEKFIKSNLPEYMTPASLVEMQTFPLTINGKLDRHALPDPDFNLMSETAVMPLTQTQKQLCQIWEEILGVERVTLTDDFFKIGGNSILAIQVSHEMSKLLKREVNVADVFSYKTIFQMMEHMTESAPVVIQKVESNHATLSFAQERLWFIEQFEEGTNAYHIPVVYELDESVDLNGVKYALQKIVSRHEVLRSTIDPEGKQVVQSFPVTFEDVILDSEVDRQRIIKDEINRPFNLSKEYPVRIKFYFIRTPEPFLEYFKREILLLINIHHIAADGWSMGIFQREFHAYFEAYVNQDRTFELPPLMIQYKDYSVWQRNYLANDILEEQLSYWEQKLSGYQTLELPTDHIRPARTNYKGARLGFKLDVELSKSLKSLARNAGVSLHSVMLSSIAILLSKYTGQDDIVIGTDIAGRHHHQTEDLIGFFVNILANRIQLNKTQSYSALILQVHQAQAEAQQYQDLPFERLVNELKVERDESRHPIFQVTFSVENFDQSRSTIKHKQFFKPYSLDEVYEVEKFDLSVTIDDSRKELAGEVSYATSLFKSETMEQLIRHYIHLLEQLVKAPNTPYCQMTLLSPKDYQTQVYDWNSTDMEFPSDKTVHELVKEQSRKTPNNIAIVCERQELSYKDLNDKSNQLAYYIREQFKKRTGKTFGPDTLIAICMERSIEMIIGILAVLKAGGAYVPIDPRYPKERIDYMLDDTQAQLILTKYMTGKDAEQELPNDKTIFIGLTEELFFKESTSDLPEYNGSMDLAYVIYTSGSTGKPKGVMIEHRGMVNHLFAKIDLLNMSDKSVIAQNASSSFDISVWQFFAPLVSGGKVIIYSDDIVLNPFRLIDHMTLNGTTILEVVPSYLDAMLDSLNSNDQGNLDSLEFLMVTGEELKPELVKRWFSVFPGKKLINAYGPTEASDDVTHHVINNYEDSKFIAIGKPIQNLKIYIVNEFMQLCPTGVKGEICVSGIGVGRGYLNNESRTNQVFMQDPFVTERNMRLYKTGDLGRWQADGSILYMGRKDEQVKIRGHRIELGEIEYILSQMDQIKQVCVLVKERQTTTSSTKYLVGYYVSASKGEAVDTADILKKLSQMLPEYMIPVALIEVRSFPLTLNGKLDKRALPDPDLSYTREYIAPRTEQEAICCTIWQEIVGVEQVGITDDFFDIGGNSILAMKVSYRMSGTLKCDFRVADIFRNKTIDQLLARVQSKDGLKLIKPYNLNYDSYLTDFIFVHPANADCEVYHNLAESLVSKFNCIGIDNYNIHNVTKIGSLNNLANLYISEFESEYALQDPVNLIGWSLGGTIALEMARILERRGYENINVILLDTVVADETIRTLTKQIPMDELIMYIKEQVKEVAQLRYAEKIISAFNVEMELSNTVDFEVRLKHTRIVLFKAMEKDSRHNNETMQSMNDYILSLPMNNLETVADHVKIINMDCQHGNILEKCNSKISQYLLTGKHFHKPTNGIKKETGLLC